MPTENPPHLQLMAWLTFITTVGFGLFVCLDLGLLQALVASDQSKLSVAVLLLFGLCCLHAAVRIFSISFTIEAFDTATRGVSAEDLHIDEDGGFHLPAGRSLPAGPMRVFLNDVADQTRHADASLDNEDMSDLADIFANAVKRSHDYGWYAVDIVIKIGLLGTIIGFILMLGSIADSTELDVNTMQKVLTQMSRGMGTALYTTLAGLSASILLGAQYLIADKGADAMIERGLKFAHLAVVPAVDRWRRLKA